MRRAAGLIGMFLAALTIASGCGEESQHGVRASIEQLASISSEGSLMADDVARGRTKTTFVRVHGEELSAQAEHESEKLNDDAIPKRLEGRAAIAVTLASEIGGLIDDLRTSPDDRRTARENAGKLKTLAGRADQLAKSL